MKHWKSYVGSVIALGGLAALVHFTAKPLLAQVKAALVENIDEPARNPYSEDFVTGLSPLSGGCQQPSYCEFASKVVPAGRRLVITNISGYAIASNAQGAIATWQSTTGVTRYLAYRTSSGGTYRDNINFEAPVRFYLEAGDSYSIILSIGLFERLFGGTITV